MKAHVLTGSKGDIVDSVIRIEGDIREVIVFVDEPGASSAAPGERDIFAEMEPFMVQVKDVDYSREALYSRMEGE